MEETFFYFGYYFFKLFFSTKYQVACPNLLTMRQLMSSSSPVSLL